VTILSLLKEKAFPLLKRSKKVKGVWVYVNIARRQRFVNKAYSLDRYVRKLKISPIEKVEYKHCEFVGRLAVKRFELGIMFHRIDDVQIAEGALKQVEMLAIKYFSYKVLYGLHNSQLVLGKSDDAKARLTYLLKNTKMLNLHQLPNMLFEVGFDKELKKVGEYRGNKYKVLKKVTLDDIASDEFHYRGEKEESSVLPYDYVKNKGYCTVSADSVFKEIVPSVRLVKDVIVDDTFSIVTEFSNEFVVYEKCADPSREFVAGLMDKFYGSSHRLTNVLAVEKNATVNYKGLSSAIHIVGRVPTNLFHLLIEYLPRFSLIIDSGLSKKNIPVLVPADIPYQFYKLIKLIIGENVELIPIKKNQKMRVRELYVPSFGSELDDTANVDMVRCGLYSPSYLSYLNGILRKVDIDMISVPDKVYLSRPSNLARGLLNAEEVEVFLKKRGYAVVDPVGLSIEQQIAIFSKAKNIVGVAGASFSWAFLAGSHTRIVSFVAEGNETYSIQHNLATSSGAKHIFVCGDRNMEKELYESKLHYFHSPFKIDVEDIQFALSN